MSKSKTYTDDLSCPIKYLMEVFGGKWKLPVICILRNGEAMRYNEIKKQLGNVTDIMLSQSLKELEKSKMIKRHQYNEVPPRVDYILTAKGKSIIPALAQMGEWAVKHMQEDNKQPECGNCISCATKD